MFHLPHISTETNHAEDHTQNQEWSQSINTRIADRVRAYSFCSYIVTREWVRMRMFKMQQNALDEAYHKFSCPLVRHCNGNVTQTTMVSLLI